jgi:hypothetical protein
MATPARKKAADALLLALACGATIDAASRQCGLSESTIYRRLRDPGFQRQLQAIRTDLVQRTAGALTAAALEAVRTLVDLQKANVQAAVRLGAARAVLEIGLKVRETAELTARIATLEARLGVQPPSLVVVNVENMAEAKSA